MSIELARRTFAHSVQTIRDAMAEQGLTADFTDTETAKTLGAFVAIDCDCQHFTTKDALRGMLESFPEFDDESRKAAMAMFRSLR